MQLEPQGVTKLCRQGESGPVSVLQSRRPGSARTKTGILTVHLGLVEACHLGVALDDCFELGMARDLSEVCKTVWSPLLHHVYYPLWPARAVVLDDLRRHRQTRGLIRLERRHDILGFGQEWRYAARIQDRLTRPVRADRIHRMRRISQQCHAAE